MDGRSSNGSCERLSVSESAERNSGSDGGGR
jgi:hypothetical protein